MSTSPRKRPASEAIVAGGVVVLMIALVGLVFVSGAGQVLYPPKAVTSQGANISTLYDIVFALGVAVFVAVEGLIIWSVLRYRRRPTDVDLPPQTHGNNFVEAIWTIIPSIIVLYLFFASAATLATVDAVSENPDIHINAVAGQFQWKFEYLDESGAVVATQTRPSGEGGGMAVPVGRTVYVTLESPDVIHAWYVPKFLFKRDVVPGQVNHLEFVVNEEEAGQVFHGQCAELCGTQHRAMLFDVVAMTQADYDAWLSDLIETASATAPPAPSGAPVLTLTAKGIAFDKTTLEAPADAPFVIEFSNEDTPGIPHDVDLREEGSTAPVKDQQTIDGGTSTSYTYDPLAPGTYTFICSIHPIPAMTGTLTVQ